MTSSGSLVAMSPSRPITASPARRSGRSVSRRFFPSRTISAAASAASARSARRWSTPLVTDPIAIRVGRVETDERTRLTVSAWPRLGADVGREVLAGERGAGGDEVGRCALEDDPAAVVAGAGAEVDDPVGVRHDRLVVLDDDDRLAGVDEPVDQAEQLLDVGEVKAAGGLVEDVDAALLGHAGGQLEPLPLAAGQRSERLAEPQV